MLSTKSLIKLLGACLLTACGTSVDDTPVVASVYGHELHQSTLSGLVPEGVSSEDSAAIVDNYIDQWIRQTVILDKAERNIKEDFSRELQEYKNTLLTYAYERQIVDQLLDTNVSESQIEEYYAQHRGDFLLKSSIVKAVYVMAPHKSPAIGKLKSVASKHNFDDNEIVEMEEIASRNGLRGYYGADTWIPFFTLQSSVPITTYNETLFLKQNRTIVLNDDSLTYIVRIVDYKVSDEIAPLETLTENIRAILLNHRKIEVLDKLHADLLKEAEEGGHVKRKKTKEDK